RSETPGLIRHAGRRVEVLPLRYCQFSPLLTISVPARFLARRGGDLTRNHEAAAPTTPLAIMSRKATRASNVTSPSVGSKADAHQSSMPSWSLAASDMRSLSHGGSHTTSTFADVTP